MQDQFLRMSVFLAALVVPVAIAQEASCSAADATSKSRALLQKGFSSSRSVSKHRNSAKPATGKVATNPSGAAAPLNDEGYSAVADRCCQAEMKLFIERVILDTGLQICASGGLEGFSPFHSCEQTSSYEQLVADLLQSSTGACPWVQTGSGACTPLPGPPTCREYPEAPPTYACGCSRSKASKVNLGAATLAPNNLGGLGPGSGASEMRFSGSPGTTSTGEAFDIVITNLDAYARGTSNNEITGDFGKILVGSGTTTFKFSFVAPGTNTPVVMPEIHMAVFDLDGHPSGADTEAVSSKGYVGYVTDPNPNSVASRLPDGRTEFKGITSGSDPSSANLLTDAQRKSSIMFFYSEVSSFELSFGSNSAYQRGLLFAFESGLNERCGP